MKNIVINRADNGVWYGQFTLFYKAGIRHGISTRLGGKSSAPFAELNLGLHTGDEPEKVVNNRKLFCEALGMNACNVVTAEQVHGDNIAVVKTEDCGRGAFAYNQAISNTDALITNLRGIPLMLFFADCVPVLIADPVKKAIGIAHAGWKGTVAKIAQKTVLKMVSEYGTDPSDCMIGIGPSIGTCCYEVDSVVLDRLKENFSGWQSLVTPKEDRWMLDLWQANKMQLVEIGVPEEKIVLSNICTSCNNKLFYSYRFENGRTGRLGAVIEL